ncbi:Flp family type IVb pilin [Desulfosediminicola sp.]|uniref:Flp family type IVb pilin n=1 Tax=Desulfosediminicola sp. TaxID=2886825 RepID=UPI003AF2EEDF
MILEKIKAFWKDEEGASLIEYVLLGALIGVAALVGMTYVGGTAENTLQTIGNEMTPAATT